MLEAVRYSDQASKTIERTELRTGCIRTFSKMAEICNCAMLAAAQLRAASLRPTALARPLLEGLLHQLRNRPGQNDSFQVQLLVMVFRDATRACRRLGCNC